MDSQPIIKEAKSEKIKKQNINISNNKNKSNMGSKKRKAKKNLSE